MCSVSDEPTLYGSLLIVHTVLKLTQYCMDRYVRWVIICWTCGIKLVNQDTAVCPGGV